MTSNLSERSQRLYDRCIANHLQGVDINNVTDVLDKVQGLSYSTRIQTLKAVFSKTQNQELLSSLTKWEEEYKSTILSRDIETIDWSNILTRLYNNRKQSYTSFQSFLLGLLMYYHPRRFGDYYLLSTIPSDTTNLYKNGSVAFNKFKNINSKTAGEKEIVLAKEVTKWIEIYISKYKVEGKFFDMTERQFRYLFTKNGIPLANHNRKFQESNAIKKGDKPRVEIARKFNHSVAVQCVYYQKPIDN